MTPFESEMRQVILAMRMLGGGRTQAFDSSGGKSENPDPRPSGEPSPLADHWVAEWARDPSERTLEAARAELQAWKRRPEPADDVDYDEDAWILKDGEGFSVEQVARKFNRTPTMIRRLRLKNDRESEFGLPTNLPRGRERVPDARERVANLTAQGCTLKQIQLQTGVPRETVRRWMKDAV